MDQQGKGRNDNEWYRIKKIKEKLLGQAERKIVSEQTIESW